MGVKGRPVAAMTRAAARLGTATWLVSLTFAIAVISMNLSPPHAGADFIAANAAAILSGLLSLAVFIFTRTQPEQAKLEWVAFSYQVLIGLGISLTELFITYDTASVVRGISWVCLWIVLFPLVVPSSSTKTLWGAVLTAGMGPVAIVIARRTGLPLANWQTLVFLTLPNFFAAGLAMVLHRILHRLRSDASLARELGAYRLEQKLGGGGMGEVWRASHRMLARPAAIKLIRRETYKHAEAGDAKTKMRAKNNSDELVERFEREAQATAALTSPHTVHIYDFGVTDDGSLYFAMELLEGRDLETLVHEAGRLDARRATHLLEQACLSLSEAHRAGLVHRDVKPANLFVGLLGGQADFLKVLDFGLVATLSESSADAERLSGTPAYVAPEVVAGNGADARADVYALACVAYHMLTGQTVFAADNAVSMLHAHLHEAPLPPSSRGAGDIPPGLEKLIMECLQKDPDARPRDAGALLGKLREISVGEWTQEEAQRWWSRHPVPKPSQPPANAALLTTFPASHQYARPNIDAPKNTSGE